jgi:hypothetical protein
MIIGIALIVAHFLDKSFYTIKTVSGAINDTVAIFSIIMRSIFISLCLYTFYKFQSVVNREPFLAVQK